MDKEMKKLIKCGETENLELKLKVDEDLGIRKYSEISGNCCLLKGLDENELHSG